MNAGTISLNSSAAFPTSGNLTMLGGTFDIHGTSPTVNNIVFGDGVATGATVLADSGTVKGAINLNGSITYNGTSARTFPASIVNTALVLSPGVHLITNTNGFYSPAANYDIVFNGVISGPGGIQKDGGSTLSVWIALNAQNTYAGPTIVTSGKLFLGVANAIPSGSAVTVNSGATLSLTAPTTEVGVTAGNYAQSVGSIAGSGTIDLGSATLTTGGDNTSTNFSGTLTGTGGLTKVGTGTQTISGTGNNYTGPTTVNGGLLLITGSVTGTTITVNSGGAVGGPGAFGSSTSATGGIVSVGAGSLNLVDGSINTLTVSGNSTGAATATLILGGATGVTSAINLETGATSTDKVIVLQSVQVNAGGAVINLTPLAGTTLAAGTYPLITYAGDTLTGAYSLGTPGYGGFSYTLSHTATAENLIVAPVATPAIAYWQGAAGAQWNTFATGAVPTNWFTTAGATTNTLQVPGSTTDVYFTTTSGATNLTNTLGADFSIKSLNFTATSASANIGGTNTLTIGTGGITSASGAAAQTLSTNLALGASQTWTNNGGTLTVSGTSITGSGMNLALGGSGNFAISAALQTGAGSLTKNGAGTLTLSGANTFTGATIINGGALTLGAANTLPSATAVSIASGASLNLAGYAQTVASITGAGNLVIGSGALTIGDSNNVTFSGNISGSGTLNKVGSGTWSLSGTSTLTGLITVSGGTIHVRANGALGDPEILAGAQIVLDAGITVSSEPLIIAGSGSAGAGALRVDVGAATWNGPIQLSADAAMGAASGASLALSGPIDLSSHTLTFVGAGTSSVPGVITGTGNLTQGGTGTLVLGGADDFTGTLAVNSGAVQFSANNVLTNSQDVTVASGATLDIHGFTESLGSLAGAGSVTLGTGGALTVGGNGTDTTFSGGISGSGTFQKSGAGTLTLNGASSFSGGTTLSDGTVIAGHNSAFSTGSITFNGGALASDSGTRSLANSIVVSSVTGNKITGSNSLTLTGAASGSGTLEVNFSDSTKSVTVNPTTSNSFAPGTVRLTSGTLLLGGSNKIGNGTGVNFNGGTLATGGNSDTVGALTLSSNSMLDFGTSNNSHLQFSSASWTGGTLTVNNWTGTEFTSGNPDQFLVASAGPIDSGFLSQISFTGHGPGAIAFDVGGGVFEIVPVPEPATIFGALGLAAFIGFRERRRIGRLFGKAA